MSIQQALDSVGEIFNHRKGNITLAVDAVILDLILAYPIEVSLCRKIFATLNECYICDAYNAISNSKPILDAREEYNDYLVGNSISVQSLKMIARGLKTDSLIRNFVKIFEHCIKEQLNKEQYQH